MLKHTAEFKQQVVNAYCNGMQPKDILTTFKIGYSSFYRWMRLLAPYNLRKQGGWSHITSGQIDRTPAHKRLISRISIPYSPPPSGSPSGFITPIPVARLMAGK